MSATRNILLYPVSLLYGLITAFRNFLYDSGILRTTSFPVPVICVGNITVGGTGKTPHTEYLISILRANFKTAVLSRGYKRKTDDFRIASSTSDVNEIGDEPVQIFRKFPDVIVAVDKNRVNGVRRIMEVVPQTDVIILDDGYQHRSIKPGLSILLSDFERPLIRDHMLPFGNLREYRSNSRRADIILVTKCPKNLNALQRRLICKEIGKATFQSLYFTTFSYRTPRPVFGNHNTAGAGLDLAKCSECDVVMVTGIANPGPLKEYIRKFFRNITELNYPDHYSFNEDDIRDIITKFNNLESTTKYIITTEKDAVRLRNYEDKAEAVKSSFYYIPVGISFLNDDKEEFDKLVMDYVRKDTPNNRFSER